MFCRPKHCSLRSSTPCFCLNWLREAQQLQRHRALAARARLFKHGAYAPYVLWEGATNPVRQVGEPAREQQLCSLGRCCFSHYFCSQMPLRGMCAIVLEAGFLKSAEFFRRARPTSDSHEAVGGRRSVAVQTLATVQSVMNFHDDA